MKIFKHGENSITFTLFTILTDTQLAKRLLSKNVSWTQTFTCRPDELNAIHLFPNFGKKYGYGEPDAIIITKTHVIYVEVELVDLSKRKIPENFMKQMRKFVSLAKDLKCSRIKRLRSKFIGEDNYSFYGKRRLRSLFLQIQKKKPSPAFLVISDGKKLDIQSLANRLGIPQGVPFGWIGFPKLKKMKNIQRIVEVINHNLSK